MFAVTGITGQVGSAVAENLLQQGHKVRALVRDPDKGRRWKEKGCELAVGDFNDPAALARAFSNVQGAFIMIPANFAPSPDFREPRAILAAVKQALATARPPKIVCLSSIGAHRSSGLGLITQLNLLENELQNSAPAVAFLRPAWFMENSVWDIAPAQATGQMPAFLSPLDKPIPMIATADIGRIAAEVLAENWVGRRVIEIEGPQRYSPNDLAASLAVALGRPVCAAAVPRAEWEALFRSQGTPNPQPRIEMLDGFNSNWIIFQGNPAEHRASPTSLQTVLQALVARTV